METRVSNDSSDAVSLSSLVKAVALALVPFDDSQLLRQCEEACYQILRRGFLNLDQLLGFVEQGRFAFHDSLRSDRPGIVIANSKYDDGPFVMVNGVWFTFGYSNITKSTDPPTGLVEIVTYNLRPEVAEEPQDAESETVAVGSR